MKNKPKPKPQPFKPTPKPPKGRVPGSASKPGKPAGTAKPKPLGRLKLGKPANSGGGLNPKNLDIGNVNLSKGAGPKRGIPGAMVPGPDGKPTLGKNQTMYGGKVFNQKGFAGLVREIGGVKAARSYLKARPGALSQLGMTREQADNALGLIKQRNARANRLRKNRPGY